LILRPGELDRKQLYRYGYNWIILKCQVRNVVVKFLEWFYCASWREPCDVIMLKTCLCNFTLHQLRFQRINTGYVKAVALMRWVFLRLVAEMSERFLEQRGNIGLCVKLLLEMRHGAFIMISKANYKVCYGNSRHPHDPRNLAYRNHKCKGRCSLLIHSTMPNSQPGLLYGNIVAVTWSCA